MSYSVAQLQQIALQAGWPASLAPTAAAVAMAESRGNPAARLTTGREDSIGLWQINTYAHPQFSKTSLMDPAYNARAALQVYGASGSFRPWTTYVSGAYRKYMQGSSGADYVANSGGDYSINPLGDFSFGEFGLSQLSLGTETGIGAGGALALALGAFLIYELL